MASSDLILVNILALVEDETSGNPIVVLYDPESNRVMPVWIGSPEARAIALALDRGKNKRPLTHTLLLNVVEELGGALEHATITALKGNTYYATLCIEAEDGVHTIDARPSDAIALAVESDVPLFVDPGVFKKASHENPFPVPPAAFERTQRALENLTGENLKKLRGMLEKAREREQQAGE